jgi:hypothetical protein
MIVRTVKGGVAPQVHSQDSSLALAGRATVLDDGGAAGYPGGERADRVGDRDARQELGEVDGISRDRGEGPGFEGFDAAEATR